MPAKPRKPAQKKAATTSKRRPASKRKPTAKLDTISLRELTSADDAFLLASTRETMKEVFEKSVGMELTDQLILSQIKSSGTTLIVEQKGTPIGYTCYTLHKPKRMYWGALVLVPTAQDQGIGSRICHHMFELARLKGCEAIDGHVQVENQVAIKFWKSHGFEVVGGPIAGSYEIEKKLK